MKISNQNLRESDIPAAGGCWEEFALTFDTEAFLQGKGNYAEMAEQVAEIYDKSGDLSDLSLSELRAALLFIQRRKRWSDGYDDFDETNLEFVCALLDTIRQKIKSNNQDNPDRTSSIANRKGNKMDHNLVVAYSSFTSSNNQEKNAGVDTFCFTGVRKMSRRKMILFIRSM